MKAPVRKIIGQSTVDGPGNRTAIFLQGCNIRCAYCHNPETQPLHADDVEMMTVDDVVEEVKKGIPFIRGITVSGGECMLHQPFLLELFRKVHALDAKLSCLADSNGTYLFTEPLLSEVDGVLLDVKAWDASVWKNLTGSSTNEVVKQNLKNLLLRDKVAEVRIVCLPKEGPIQTDVEAVIAGVKAVASECGRPMPKMHLIAFRPHGVVGSLAEAPMTPAEEMKVYDSLLR